MSADGLNTMISGKDDNSSSSRAANLEKPKIGRLGSKIGRNSKILFAKIVSFFGTF